MNVLHLSTADIEQGAARAAYRLHSGLKQIGISSEMLVRSKQTLDPTVHVSSSLITKVSPLIDGLPVRVYRDRDRDVFSAQWFPGKVIQSVQSLQPDIINLHWITNGFLQIESLRQLNRPLVWTLHDMWPFTGGCHYARDCKGYLEQCGSCDHLNSQRGWDLSRWIWHRKAKAWSDLNITVVSPSHWLAECTQASRLMQHCSVHVIPNGLDTQAYRPVDVEMARELLNLPQDKKIVLFGASPGLTEGSRKGIQYLLPALQQLKHCQDEIELVVFGAITPDSPPDLGYPIRYLGKFHDDLSLSLIYSAADVMVVPSVQDAFGQTATEAMACGTPVVAFRATGPKDIVKHQQTGYLAEPFVPADLARGIDWVLTDAERYQRLTVAARQFAEREFSLEVQACRYHSLYESLAKPC